MTDGRGESSIRTLAQNAVQANKDHQHALKIYTERLEAELETVDKLLDAADTADQNEEPELDVGGFILVPGSVKPTGLIAPADLSSQDSPFYEDAARRTRYLNFTEMHTMKYREIEALTEAVRTENYRRHALDAQSRGHRAFAAITDQPSNYLELNKAGIDWGRVAEKISSVSSTPRSARECEIRWLGDRHPEINHSNWDQEEVARLKAMVSDVPEGQVDWVDIAEKLETKRTPLDCMKHAITRKIHVWDSQSDKRLMEAMDRYGTENWHLIARYVSEDATPAQCTNRYYRSLDPGLKRGAWTPEEDERLRLAYAAFGASWIDVASVVPGRNNDQCRDRWMDKLNPSVSKGKWSDDEDRLLMKTIGALGIASWKEISDRMSGRTDNMCRNRYETLKKKDKNITPASSLSTSGPSREASRPRKTKTTVLPAASTVNVADQQATEVIAPKPRPRPRPTRKHDIQFVDPIVASYPDNRSSPTKKTEVANKDKSKDQGRGKGKGKGKEKATESVSGGVASFSTSEVVTHENIPGDSAAAPPIKKRKTSRPAPRNAKGEDRENMGSLIKTSNVDIDANGIGEVSDSTTGRGSTVVTIAHLTRSGNASLVDAARAEARPPDSTGFQANIGPPSRSQFSSTNPEIVHNDDKQAHSSDSLATDAPPIKPTKGGRKKPTTTVPPTRVQPQRTSRKTGTST